MTTPALQRLREAFPEAYIALLVPQKLAELWERHPSLNAVLTSIPGEGPWPVASRLRAGNFDTALVLPNSPRSALEVWLAGIPRRIGYARPWRNWFLSQTVPPRPIQSGMRKRSASEIRRLIRVPANAAVPASRDFPPELGQKQLTHHSAHQMHDYLHLAAVLGAKPEPLPPLLAIEPSEAQAVQAKFGLNSQLTGGRPLLALNPGAEYGPAKRWPLDRFAAAARAIQTQTQCAWLLLGGPADVPLVDELYSALGGENSETHHLAGKTSLRELMALLELSRVLLGNDSGTMHVAAALGTPVVVPFGSTSPELTGPGLPGDARHHALRVEAACAPCFRRFCPIDFRCMTGISIDDIVAAVQAAMARHLGNTS